MSIVLIVLMAVFGVAALLSLVRIVLGPSILDRAVASDVLLTEVLCVLGAEMAINHHTRSIPAMLIIAAVGVFGTIAVARFVARRDTVVLQDSAREDAGAARAEARAGRRRESARRKEEGER